MEAVTGDPSFPDSRTGILPGRLQAGKICRLGIHSAAHTGFVTAADSSLTAEAYTLLFPTAS